MTGSRMARVPALVVLVLCLAEAGRTNKRDYGHHSNKTDADAAEENVESLLGPYDGFLKYKGCFTTPSTFYKERTDSYNNNNECAKFCSDIGKNIIGTMGMKCYCLDHVPSVNQSDMECSRRCPDSLLRGVCSGYDCCGGEGKVSVYSTKSQRHRDAAKRSAQSMKIQGCFNDMAADILKNKNTLTRVDSENTLLRCNEFCLEKGFAVSSLRTDHCYCTNVMPLDRLYEGVDGAKECSMYCAGIFGQSGQCEKDQCCGGQQQDGRHTYTVYISGTINILKQMLRRIQTNFISKPQLLGKKVWGGPLCPDGWKSYKLSCYQLSKEKRSYDDAKRDCEKKGAHLFTVPTEEDKEIWESELMTVQKAFEEKMPPKRRKLAQKYKFINTGFFKTKRTWIGLAFNDKRNRWEWANGAPVNIKMFIPEPCKECGDIKMCPGYARRWHEKRGTIMTSSVECKAKLYYFCQSFVKIVSKGKNPSGGKTTKQATFQSYSMELDFPERLKEEMSIPILPKNRKVLKMTVVDFREQIKKEQSPSSKFLAGSDVLYRNKDSDTAAKFIYTHTTETSSSLTVTKSSGGSLAAEVGMEFTTKYFGLAENKFSVKYTLESNWQSGTDTFNSDTVTHSYSFEFPIPARCDATIAIMKNEMPTRIDWRASFYASGWVEVEVLGRKKTIDVSRILKRSQRYIYSFGTNDFGARPTIVPVKTLSCKGQDKPKQVVMEKCTNPDTGKPEPCRKQLKKAKSYSKGKGR